MSPLRSSHHVIVVGAGLAGWRFVEALRREGFSGDITVVGDEVHPPYDRPPLSKQVLAGKWALDKARLASDEQIAASEATLRLGVAATTLEVASTTVGLADGSVVAGSHVVLATGSRARALSFPSSGLLSTLRNYDDLTRLGRELDGLGPGEVVVVIGGGFVGAEAATSLKSRGFTPVVLEVAERPLMGVVGDEVSTWLANLAANADIELRTNQHLVDVRLVNGGVIIDFADGTTLEAGAVLASVGSALDLDWLETSGLTLDNGVVVDADLQAAPHVAAIGDIARFPLAGSLDDELVRIEHWQVATDHAAHLARFWHGDEAPSGAMIPYFWSDQYGKKIQMLGHPHPSDEVTLVAGAREDAKWLALYSRADVVTGIVSLSQPRGLALAKSLLEVPTTLASALERAPWAG